MTLVYLKTLFKATAGLNGAMSTRAHPKGSACLLEVGVSPQCTQEWRIFQVAKIRGHLSSSEVLVDGRTQSLLLRCSLPLCRVYFLRSCLYLTRLPELFMQTVSFLPARATYISLPPNSKFLKVPSRRGHVAWDSSLGDCTTSQPSQCCPIFKIKKKKKMFGQSPKRVERRPSRPRHLHQVPCFQ